MRAIWPFPPLVRLGLFTLLMRSVGWMLTPWLGSRIGFSFLCESAFIGLVLRIGPATSFLVKYASTRLLSLLGLGYPSILW